MTTWRQRTFHWRRRLIRYLDRTVGTKEIPHLERKAARTPDVFTAEAGRRLDIHLLEDHVYKETVCLLPGDRIDLSVGARTVSGFAVPEPLVIAIDTFNFQMDDPYRRMAYRFVPTPVALIPETSADDALEIEREDDDE